MIVANEHSRVDPVSTFGLDITECLAIVLHKTVGIDSIEAALEDFSLDRAFYLSEGYEGAQADKRWSAIMAALQSAVFQRDGHILLWGPEYNIRRAARRQASKARAVGDAERRDAQGG
ncbi:hypothetical protein CLAFUW4_01047 [Fulvia fulva]|uniref:Uncharacterized protein n=1 Tax=Passalora fulva TaxID=5499 RepID=A0A9Q8L807_PASFU|nr:uncharacterized protein CLAFUR5_01052 [Fulvia fulva]KAK4635645.1 hypothetical protein CLAFUR4_01048 [Fulvia fulva]KAK4638099.1 hypothetical protein CLAFUR0_01049 [Fulvia fulva]UJO12514.1 hypothetical protein CLAFUR5_01052 [Fulvia fulva]WPV08233.1 hypothetical protein CLAFUW4_01047 [Fulvia fulva]WPV23439.1 hypothetical protein CLAFUW7_01052 [Fulvia fulva]